MGSSLIHRPPSARFTGAVPRQRDPLCRREASTGRGGPCAAAAALCRLVFVLGLLWLVTPAAAHPHIFIDAEADISFDDSGAVTQVTNHWTFDEAFSVWMVQGLDTDGDGTVTPAEMAGLAQEHLEGLAQYHFYTFAGEGSEDLALGGWSDAGLVYEDGRVTLSFSVDLAEPYRIRDELELAINDPEYYVSITFADLGTVRLVNAPASCSARLSPPREMPDALAAELWALPPDVTQLPPALAAAIRGVQGAILIACGATAPAVQTAQQAAEALAQPTRIAPFGGPPPEPGLAMPQTGFLGWVNTQQRAFYQALNAALGELRTDFNAFWVLGGLSFLYGIFHAAGPGHGKVVISSYVLANESEVRRGVALSFLAALLQALVAIVFVGIAAAILGLTSAAMGDATWWIGVASYALVAALGLWLILRKLFGFGHGRHDHHDHHDHAHSDDGHSQPGGHDHTEIHDHCTHHHVVPADAARADWREQAGVVLAVGLRPCSGALVVLVFALSQGLLAAGIVAVLLMGLGTAITVAVLASLAVGAKGLARRLLGSRGGLATAVVWWAELLAAVAVFAFGVTLLLASL